MNYIPYERIPVPAVWAAFVLFVIAGIPEVSWERVEHKSLIGGYNAAIPGTVGYGLF